METQIVMRAGNDNATPPTAAAEAAISQPAASSAARLDGTSSICLQDCPAQGGESWIVGNIAGDQIADQVGIRQFQKGRERGTFVTCALVHCTQVTKQQEIQFLHTAPAAPLELAQLDWRLRVQYFQALTRHAGKRRRSDGVR